MTSYLRIHDILSYLYSTLLGFYMLRLLHLYRISYLYLEIGGTIKTKLLRIEDLITETKIGALKRFNLPVMDSTITISC